jgi:protein TonB
VGKWRLKKSSGYSILDKSALDSVRTWRFEPAKYRGSPITMWVDVPIRFALVRD